MTVFVLICSEGVSTGYHELIGLYSTQEKAEEMKQVDMLKTIRGEWHYSIKPVEIDKTLKIIYDEW